MLTGGLMNKELIIVTGASSGIGKAVAEKFSAEGHPLLLLARRVNMLKQFSLPNTLCVEANILDINKLNQAIAEAEELYGPVGAMINNAGVMYFSEFAKQETNEWEEMIQTNVLGMLNGMHSVINSMKNRMNGTIINISSIAGQKTLPSAAVYCASKFAVNAFSEAIRAELAAYNVRVVTVSPGGVETDLHTHMSDKQEQKNYQEWINQINLLTPKELADMVWYSYSLPQHICLRQVVIAPTNQTV
jgi:NADP-dependent 3-hydroxy acid dehydrogenase YdfG